MKKLSHLPVEKHDRVECSEYLLLFASSTQSMQIPGIELGYFQAKEMLEPTLVRWIQNICALHPSFHLDTTAFVDENVNLKKLSSQLHLLDDFLVGNGCPAFYSIRPESTTTAGEFEIDTVLLLKKKGVDDSPLLIHSFPLQQSAA